MDKPAEVTRRLDAALVEQGLASGREKAKERIAAGEILVNGCPARKASQPVTAADVISANAPPPRYVGRGGYKLEKALQETGLTVAGICAMDVGASTGGFTDCLLQHGAARVYAVDVGHGQLHDRLRRDPRVVNCEGIDIRDTGALAAYVAENTVHFCTIDVSFIQIRRVFPSLLSYLRRPATVVCLIKPQFEAGRQAVGKRGVVRDPAVHEQVLAAYCHYFGEEGCRVEWLTYSPITGGDGNIEYLAVLTADGEPHDNNEAAHRAGEVVHSAHAALRAAHEEE